MFKEVDILTRPAPARRDAPYSQASIAPPFSTRMAERRAISSEERGFS